MDWKIIFRSLKNKDMLKRVLAVLLIIIVFRLMSNIPVPLAEPRSLHSILESTLSSSQFGGFLNMLSGGALASFSIMLVGLSPYITASIITQLLSKAIPKLEELNNDGESGRRKINQWTRILTLPLAIIQSIAYVFILRQTVLQGEVLADMDIFQWVIAIVAMAAGSIILMWLGEIITEKGVGNGISLLIFAGIISQLPTTLGGMIYGLTSFEDGQALNVFNWFTLPINAEMAYIVLAVGVISLLVLYFLVKINEAQRIVTINYAKRVRGNTAYSGVKSILPIKMITAGVIPVIFAVAFLSLPAFVGQLLVASGNPDFKALGDNLVLWFQSPNAASIVAYGMFDWTSLIYPIAYFLLVILFTYFYTSIVFNAHEIAENLQKQGGFIEGVRPGKQTEDYLKRTVNRLTLFGAIALGFIAILPFAFEYGFAFLGYSGINLAIGGTGLLIVVSVALESLRQVNSRALMVTYDDFDV
jgi:preprotein translocase, SecY subunit